MTSAVEPNEFMAAELLRVEVAAGLPDRQCLVELQLPVGSTVQDALEAADLPRLLPGLTVETGRIGVFGRLCAPDRILKDGDRVEIYRPLKADPKEVRRQLAELERSRTRAGGDG
jgi:putative ubiquitin-RnfH superfamily antitoxin RatB of RatAB toxin-antitoxin module